MEIADDLKFDFVKALKSIRHYPYKMPINPLWKDQQCPCRKLEKSEWPKEKVYPWSPPRFFDA